MNKLTFFPNSVNLTLSSTPKFLTANSKPSTDEWDTLIEADWACLLSYLKYLDSPKCNCDCWDLNLLSKDTNSYSWSNTSEVYIIAFIVQNANGKHYQFQICSRKKKRKKKKSEWKANPEYLIELVIATEQICNCKKCGKKNKNKPRIC